MRLHIPRAYYFPIAFLTGIAIGYMPATWYFQSKVVPLSAATMINTSQTTLRGTVQGIDTSAKRIIFDAVSPYSPRERAIFSATYDDATDFLKAPPVNGYSDLFLPSTQPPPVDPEDVETGVPVTVRLSRDPGPLRAFWVVIRAPND